MSYYSLVGVLAFLILIITNYEVFFKRIDRNETRTKKIYRLFLISVMLYYVTDVLWGVFEANHLTTLLYIDTEIYFMVMALGILFWTGYTAEYLDDNNLFNKLLKYSGILFFASVMVLTFINFFYPVMFWFDEEGLYHTAAARYVTLIVQIVLLFLTSVYALIVAFKTGGTGKKRHLAIGLSGLIMLIFISIQIFFPYLPLYAIAYMLGCCLLRTFVIENEKEEYRENLAVALEREKKQVEELNTAWKAAYTDALTGVRSTLAYSEKQADIDKRIAEDSLAELGVAVFDLNDLKKINDNLGHDVGDEYIKEACKLICTVFDHSPVYRIGGDEFAAILEGADYKNRDNLLQLFNRHVQKNIDDGSVIISVGIAEYIKGRDNSYKRIFERADLGMYEQKKKMKQQHTAL